MTNLETGQSALDITQMDIPLVETQSLEIVTATLHSLLKETDKEIEWKELSKFKVPFTTKNAQVNVERVLELISIKVDNLNQQDIEIVSDENEPFPGARDDKMPRQAAIKHKAPPFKVKQMDGQNLDRLIVVRPTKRKVSQTPLNKQRLLKGNSRYFGASLYGGSLKLGQHETILDTEGDRLSDKTPKSQISRRQSVAGSTALSPLSRRSNLTKIGKQ